jgi:predicted DNA binding CopG/RHH family protein
MKTTKTNKTVVVVTDKMPDSYVDDSELWENGTYGQSLKHAAPASRKHQAAINNALGLAPISIRLQKTLVEDLKEMARKEGLAYQAYIRQILTRHVSEKKS